MYNPLLEAFVCVADCGSFTKAADQLYISSTAVMNQINSLEQHLNLTLMERTRRGVHLTEAGKAVYKDAKYLFEFSRKSIDHARQLAQTSEKLFRVGSSLLNPCRPFMDLWQDASKKFPGYRMQIVPFEDDHTGILAEVSALGKKFDFLVAVCDSRQWLNRCNMYKLGEYRVQCSVSHNHPLASKKSLCVEDLYGERLMMYGRGDSPALDSIRDILDSHDQIYIEDTPFYDIEVFNRCEAGLAVLLTLDCWADIHPLLVTIPLAGDYSVPYGLLYATDPSDDVLQFLDVIRSV